MKEGIKVEFTIEHNGNVYVVPRIEAISKIENNSFTLHTAGQDCDFTSASMEEIIAIRKRFVDAVNVYYSQMFLMQKVQAELASVTIATYAEAMKKQESKIVTFPEKRIVGPDGDPA